MPTTITCPECDARMVVPDNVLGKKIRCKKCDAVVKTKAPVEADDDEPRPKKTSNRQSPKGDDERRAKRRPDDDEPRRRPARNDDDDDEEEDERPARKSKKKKKKSNPVLYFVGLFLALIFAGGAIAFAFGAFDKPKGDKNRTVEENTINDVKGGKAIVAIAHYDLSNFRTETVRSTEIVKIDYKATTHMKSELDYLIVTEFEGGFTTIELRGDKQKGELLVNVPVGGWKPGSKIWVGRPQSTNPGALPIRVSNAITVP
jgi:transcription initiation factor TFIIIB Brf1 subunit/transcription initiation factor TFIIB